MIALIILAITTVAAIWEAFALKVLWGWFLVPLGLPAIGMAHAVGLALIATLLTHQAPSNMTSDERQSQVIGWGLATPAVALIVGWIAKGFM
jgi:hypothetical protein